MRCAALALLLAVPAAARGGDTPPDPRINALLETITPERLRQTLEPLAAFETRHTLSRLDQPRRGIGAAREWIRRELAAASPRLQVAFDAYDVPAQGERITRDVDLRNVVAVLPGRSPRRIYVSGHYDTVARAPQAGPASATGGFDWTQTDNPAPGANDDGSGTALTLEVARALAGSGIEFDATLVFVAFAGEEQGLVGATLHAQKALEAKAPIEAVLNNDIVGGSEGGQGVRDSASVRIFSDGPEDSPSRALARAVRRIAATYVPAHRVRLVARYDRFGRGGDHIPFSQRGYAAVRFTESKENYARQHTADDTLAGVDYDYLARNARVNAAAAAELALAPAAPVVSDERGRPQLGRGPTGYDAALRWTRAPGAVAYRVVWREAWAPDWQHERRVGDVDALVLPGLSIDDYVFGVSAIGPGGHESLVAAYVNPPRAPAEIRTR
jgi:hypothetical protein